jgi:hypothetical protein
MSPRRSASEVRSCERGLSADERVTPHKQIAQRPQPESILPTPSAMFDGIVNHVAALAQCSQIALVIVGWIVVEVSASEENAGRVCLQDQRANRSDRAAAVAPLQRVFIPPHAIAEMFYVMPMRPTAMVALSFGARKANPVRQLQPVDRVEPAMFGADRHRDDLNHGLRKGKRRVPAGKRIESR